MKEACKSGSGILFDPDKIDRYDFRLPKEDESWSDPDADTKFYREPRDEDVKSASHISSVLKWGWLEFLPVLERKQAEAGKWVLVPRWVQSLPFTVRANCAGCVHTDSLRKIMRQGQPSEEQDNSSGPVACTACGLVQVLSTIQHGALTNVWNPTRMGY